MNSNVWKAFQTDVIKALSIFTQVEFNSIAMADAITQIDIPTPLNDRGKTWSI